MKIKVPNDVVIKDKSPAIDLTIWMLLAFGLNTASKPMNPYHVGERYFNDSYLKPVLNNSKIIKSVNDIVRAVDELSASNEMFRQSPTKNPKYNVNTNQEDTAYKGV